jgi:hypothetical protein
LKTVAVTLFTLKILNQNVVRMRKLLLWCLLCPVFAFSQQRLHVTVFGGIANYAGDLQDKKFTLDQSNLAVGLGAKYDLTPHFAVRGGINYSKVEGDDKLSSDVFLRARNLSFQTRILEGNLLLEYTLFDMEEKRVSPYVFGGVAVFHYNPYAFDSLGNKVFLKPLSTEGQGLSQYPGSKPYSLTQFAIPFGAGVKFRISQNTVLSYEIGLRKTFTDHLDDVSGTYVDLFTLAQERGLKAVEMAYRGGEVKGGDPTYPADGSVRGGSKYKDWYYFTGFTLYIGLGAFGGNGFESRKKGSQYGCPQPVY